MHVHVEDGRYFLQSTDLEFDVITGEPPPPKSAGIVNLFTTEFFELVRARLAEGGIVSYWLPAHSLLEHEAKGIVRAFCDVFDDCSLWEGAGLDFILLGTRRAVGPVSSEHFSRQWHDPAIAPELRDIGIERPEQLGALFLGDAGWLNELTRDTPPVDDDHPKRIGRDPMNVKKMVRLYRRWLDRAGRREDFAASPLVDRLWPASMRAASLPYFGIERQDGDDSESAVARTLRTVHRLQTTSPLRTQAHWKLGGNAQSLRTARAAAARGKGGPRLVYELGLGALAGREYSTAATLFERAERKGVEEPAAAPYRVYALAMAGRREEAARAARGAGLPEAEPDAWRFLATTFDLNAPSAQAAPP